MTGHRCVSLTIAALGLVCLVAGQALGTPAFPVVAFDPGNSGYDAGNNWWVYSYIVENPPTAPDEVYWFDLSGLGGYLGVEPVPTGWGMTVNPPSVPYTPTSIDWIADFPPPDYQVAPGQNLPGFSFHSSQAPGQVPYALFGSDSSGDPTGSEYDGTTTGPAPEPSCLAFFVAGLVPLGLAWRRRRKS